LHSRYGTALRSILETEEIPFTQTNGEKRVGKISCSASLKGSKLTITIVNVHYSEGAEVELRLYENRPFRMSRQVVLRASDPHMFNSFKEPGNVAPANIAVDLSGRDFRIDVPAASVMLLEIDFINGIRS
jgi:alpha-L-arabinofuranosidase